MGKYFTKEYNIPVLARSFEGLEGVRYAEPNGMCYIYPPSDIDLAIRGCPKGAFFHLLGRLLLELDYPVDLVSLDRQNDFAHYLEKEGGLLRIG